MNHWKSVLFAIVCAILVVSSTTWTILTIAPYLVTQQSIIQNQQAIAQALNALEPRVRNLEGQKPDVRVSK